MTRRLALCALSLALAGCMAGQVWSVVPPLLAMLGATPAMAQTASHAPLVDAPGMDIRFELLDLRRQVAQLESEVLDLRLEQASRRQGCGCSVSMLDQVDEGEGEP